MAPNEVAALSATMTDEEFHAYALQLLGRELGAYGLARFLRTCRSGSGDYTQERHEWQDGMTVQDVIAQL